MNALLPETGGGACAEVLVWPAQSRKLAPCAQGCASGSDVRQWVGLIAQRAKLKLGKAQAYSRAWHQITETNPFPATLGRICPHPCETACNRSGKDGAVAINAMERFLGDWGLERNLRLMRLEPSSRSASIGVIGSGPAGLSFAYQLARRGHRLTVYEKRQHAGGMLRYGIPGYRLPKSVLQAEIDRILALGVDFRPNVAVGTELAVDELRKRHELLFLGIGAGRAARLGVPGEDGPGVFGGIDFLDAANRGEPLGELDEVVVVGGGNTAIDAARTARRHGARVTLLYRRTREEMPAVADEVDAALAEGVTIEFLAAPTAIRREQNLPCAVVAQRMSLGEPDASGRRRPIPVEGAAFEVPARVVIGAVSQTLIWDGLEALGSIGTSLRPGEDGVLGEGVWAGGDALEPGIAGVAIAQGRKAAEAVHAMLTNAKRPAAQAPTRIAASEVRQDYYAARTPVRIAERPVAERIAQAELEVRETISEAAFLEEVERCFSCGQCHGCQHCFMYCNKGNFVRMEQPRPGAYFALSLECCMGCGKCIELCPTGFLSPAEGRPLAAGAA